MLVSILSNVADRPQTASQMTMTLIRDRSHSSLTNSTSMPKLIARVLRMEAGHWEIGKA